jgi:hypothetical protein
VASNIGGNDDKVDVRVMKRRDDLFGEVWHVPNIPLREDAKIRVSATVPAG